MELSSVAQARSQIRLDRSLLQQLSKRAPMRLLSQTLMEWICIVGLVIAATRIDHPAVSVACMLLIATRQHALLVLMHEYAHHQFSRRRAWINDMLGDALTALPFLITVHGFRRNHMAHHQHVKTDDDPNWIAAIKRPRYQYPKTKTQTYIEMAKHVVGWYTLEELNRYTVDAGMAVRLPRRTRWFRMAYALIVFALIAYFELWLVVLLYWVVPLATFLMGLLYVHDRNAVSGHRWFENRARQLDGADFFLSPWRQLPCGTSSLSLGAFPPSEAAS
jgi:fatty acid desaturase